MKKSENVLLNRKLKNIKKIERRKSKINIDIISINHLIEILNKHQEKSLHDISILKHYILNKTKIIEKFANDHLDESSYDNLLSLSLPSSSYKNIKNENSTVINIGDHADYLYIILKGKAAIYEMQKNHKEMSGYEYYLLLQKYKENKEKYLLEKTIAENNLVFPIETEDIYNLDKIILKIFLNKQEKKILPNYLDLIIEKAGLKYSDFKLESYIEKIEKRNRTIIEGMDIENLTLEEKIIEYKKIMIYNIQDAWNVAYRNEKKILEELSSIDIEVIKKYIYLTKTKNEELVTFYKCVFTKTIENKDYFGESEYRIYINKVISLCDNLELFCIKTDLYNEFVRKIKSKLLANQFNFLLYNFYFSSIYKNYFEKNYFKFFDLAQYKIKQIIVKENDPVHFCYFIKTVSIKLTSKRSILENHILIDLIKNILLKNEYSFNFHTSLNEIYSKVENNIDYLNNEINIKNNIHIMTLQEKNSIGNECYYYGLNYLYTAEANSDDVELYKISTDKLMKILRDKNHRSFYFFKKYCEQNLRILFDRLIKLNDISLINMKKNKVRQFGDIYNFDIDKYEEKINKNDKKINNIVDKLKLFTSKILYNNNDINNSFTEKELDKFNDINDINDTKKSNISSNLNFFLTQKPSNAGFKKINNNVIINLKKRCDSVRDTNENNVISQNHRILQNMYKNKSYNLFPENNEKEVKKDLTSYIKVFDYKENLKKQENREELRAKMGLVRLAKAERNEIKKLKKEYKTHQNFFKVSLGANRNFAIPFEFKGTSFIDINKKKDENELQDYSNNNYIIDLYQRNVFKKNRMLMTSLYKNKFSDYFDKKMGINNFIYDMSKTFLVNKKKFEYSVFDNRFNNNKKNKSRSVPPRHRKYINIYEMNKFKKNIKDFHLIKKEKIK